ncbi:hypothetical protein D3C81_1929860 [compost metagenome]
MLQCQADLVFAHGFDGGDLLAGGGRHRRHAGADGYTIEVHGAGAAQGHAAAEFGAGHAQFVAQGPQQGRVFRQGKLVLFAIDGQGRHVYSSVGAGTESATAIRHTD